MLHTVRGLDQFSHLWIIFWFHSLKKDQWKPLVKPPRLGGKTGVGVFASRSPYRPNPLGLSLVKCEGVEVASDGQVSIAISGGDFLDGTPVLDIKPYIQYSESPNNVSSAWAAAAPFTMPVVFQDQALLQIEDIEPQLKEKLKRLIKETLAYDPRPAYETGREHDHKSWGTTILGFDVKWTVLNDTCMVTSILAKGMGSYVD
jgi:tRNA-Thr(GGU) m(6)t(6)A37 methyltransferase TsaA